MSNRPGGSNPTGQTTGGGKTTYDRVREDLAEALNRLIQQEYDVGAAYELALHRADSLALAELLKQHEAGRGDQIAALGQRVSALGAQAASSGDARRLISEARVVLGDVVGDSGLLSAMRSNLEDLRDRYLKTMESDGFVDADRKVLEAGYTTAHRHVRELEQFDDTDTAS